MKVTLIHGRYFNSWEALGLGYIGAFLRKHEPGLEINFFQGCFDDDALILEGTADSDIVAFSCTTPTFPAVQKLALRIKERNPKAHTLTGGYHPSAVGLGALIPGVDQVVVGEGEQAMLAIVRGDRRPLVHGRKMSFEELPWPDRRLLMNERNIAVAFEDTGKRITSFQSHRACPFRCQFCLDGAIKVLYPDADWRSRALVRYRAVDDLLDEIEAVTEAYGLDLIKFSDPTWNTHLDWVLEFCRRKIARGIAVPFYPNIHAGIGTEEMYKLMKLANCYEIAVGIESGSPKVLKQIGKGTTVRSIKRCVDYAKSAGILARGYFILGMPDETDDDIRLTEQLADELDLDEYGFTILCPYPGTKMYDPVKHEDVNWEAADEYSNDFWHPDHLTNERLHMWQAYLMQKFQNRLTWHNRVIAGGI